MTHTTLETDYLIAGSGAVGMAFADTLLSDSDAHMVIVDRHAAPGGHWNDAYPFVTLHQPSSFYGVNSLELSKGLKDEHGMNKGLGDLASGAEVLAYFDQVMRHRFLPSGRVQYFPMCEYLGDKRFRSVLTGNTFDVSVHRKVVDATYLKTSVPSTHTPSFTVAEGVRFMPLNKLPSVAEASDGFVVIGGGKTGIDACLWLLSQGVNADHIRWIMPRDAWLIDRRNTQSSPEFFADAMGAQAAQFEAINQAESIDDLFNRLEAAGVLQRIDRTVRPAMFHGATVSQAELAALRTITNVIRLGRVQRIERDQIVLQQGTVPTTANTVHVDCSASAISNLAMKPIFEPGLITPQTVRSYQPVFSAALIAHVEATRETDDEKNKLCSVVPLPNHDTDWLRMMIAYMVNQYQWSRDPELRQWLLGARLDGFSAMARAAAAADPQKAEIMGRIRAAAMPAVMKLQRFVGELG
jgi:hypothetical protein